MESSQSSSDKEVWGGTIQLVDGSIFAVRKNCIGYHVFEQTGTFGDFKEAKVQEIKKMVKIVLCTAVNNQIQEGKIECEGCTKFFYQIGIIGNQPKPSYAK
ncbi:MAG: hypothetical protein WCK31_01005 [bacterium]